MSCQSLPKMLPHKRLKKIAGGIFNARMFGHQCHAGCSWIRLFFFCFFFLRVSNRLDEADVLLPPTGHKQKSGLASALWDSFSLQILQDLMARDLIPPIASRQTYIMFRTCMCVLCFDCYAHSVIFFFRYMAFFMNENQIITEWKAIETICPDRDDCMTVMFSFAV